MCQVMDIKLLKHFTEQVLKIYIKKSIYKNGEVMYREKLKKIREEGFMTNDDIYNGKIATVVYLKQDHISIIVNGRDDCGLDKTLFTSVSLEIAL